MIDRYYESYPLYPSLHRLLVPVCFSASHVAYSSLRMEPQYMIIGQAAGVAAKLAIAGKKAVQEIDTTALIARLKTQGTIFQYVPSSHRRSEDSVRATGDLLHVVSPKSTQLMYYSSRLAILRNEHAKCVFCVHLRRNPGRSSTQF